MEIGLLNLFSGIPKMMSSHNTGWRIVIEHIIKQDFPDAEITHIKEGHELSQYQTIVIYNGVNYKAGTANYIGGVQPREVGKMEALADYMGMLWTYNEDCDLNFLKSKRKEFSHINSRLPSVVTLHTNSNAQHLILGDSHTVSIYQSDCKISRNDGATLHGFLKNPMSYLPNISKLNRLTLYFGNIDIRFHIARQPDPIAALEKLVKDYTTFCHRWLDRDMFDITIQGLLPIEDESRKIPGTGLYKGQPFYGTQAEREKWRTIFNEMLEYNSDYYGFTFQQPWLDAPLTFDCMEAKQSVHVRPTHYKHIKDFQ